MEVARAAAADTDELVAVVDQVSSVVVGKTEVVVLALACLLAEGHLLVEDLPGVGKTTLANALAATVGLRAHRVQMTADILPGDVTGTLAPTGGPTGELAFRPGPIFANLVVADELNRASPRAQSALLEAMEERRVSVDGTTHPLPRPFMVVATQNPTDPDGTYPLPHSQLDRFALRLSMGYPDRQAEAVLIDAGERTDRASTLPPILDAERLREHIAWARTLHLAPVVRDYLLDLVAATRTHPSLEVGASPRAALSLAATARALALVTGRTFVTPDDIQRLAVPALAHRVLVAAHAEVAGVRGVDVIADLVARLPVPPRHRR